ncbi:GLPGLI family protein [Epilithonimonas bovis DSM 19482]|uniref:GLPGLI family protein n=1 Tax=Epilithonimonas bovis DSM 19482 TaxID=1121284 RepID=A0A1U7PZJ3_9FLAO|nr:GLPGLI family protein [Epilithonimonas bovis]SIT98527.1 GLPGLI family protein [Epilithonimonas bovis DSM 19482]
MKTLKKLIILPVLLFAVMASAQETANRFFYELSFKPKKDSAKIDKVMTALDIAKDKSIYQDFTMAAQDSIIKTAVEEMQKTKAWKDLSKTIRMPKFSFKIYKIYPDMTEQYVDRISRNLFAYEEKIKFDWKILSDKEKIGEYNTQKATTEFGGRTWTAWFTTDIPFQDGPYKFYGLPGLIVKIEDQDKNYSWLLSGNKTIKDWKEFSYAEEANTKYGMSNEKKLIAKDKFEKSYIAFKQDPMAEARTQIPQNMLSMKMPGSDLTIGEMLKNQEKQLKDFFKSTDNPIEKDKKLNVGKVENLGKVKE